MIDAPDPIKPEPAIRMEWVQPTHSREEVNVAGKLLVTNATSGTPPAGISKAQHALAVVNNWRSAHSYPLLAIRINLEKTATRLDPGVLVAQRIKRLVSIKHKLERFQDMKLSQMQDLGGCRAILTNVSLIKRLAAFFEFKSQMKHDLASVDDYVTRPKPSGYRGIHMVYRFHSNNVDKTIYNGLKIEMQLRSQYQHAWATAVETVGTFSGQALKSSLGSEEWQRYFALSASAIALREKGTPVPNTPTGRIELMAELGKLAQELNVEERLSGYRRAMRAITEVAARPKGHDYFLMQLNPSQGQLMITPFKDVDEASEQYAAAEKLVQDNPGRDAVLVSVHSINALGKAYPNYFADTRMYLQLMTQALSGHARGISVPAVPISVPKLA